MMCLHTIAICEHNHQQAATMARFVNDLQERVNGGCSCVQQHPLSKGPKVFGDQGEKASTKESDQLHRRNCFAPTSIEDMTMEER